jgi:thiol:disulfide interchange protein DsbA
MKQFRKLLAALAMLFAVSAYAGEGYTMLVPPQPTNSGNKIEVLEFFFYGCPHCFHLHPALSKWEKTMPKDVKLEFVPVHFSPQQEPMAYTFYALKEMGKLNRLHDKLYKAWNIDNKMLIDMDTAADFVAQQGINRQDFVSYYKSFTVRSDVDRSLQMTLDYQISGTPTLVVDGKYVVFNQVKPEDTIRILNEVIALARKERGK